MKHVRKMQAVAAAVLLAVVGWCRGQGAPQSLCPDVFKYKEETGGQKDRWDGVLSISTDSIIYSLWLNIELDSKADLLASEVGQITSSDNIEFKIENTKMKIYPGPATNIEFFVKYNSDMKIPRVTKIRLNGREICNFNKTPERVLKLVQNYPENQVTPLLQLKVLRPDFSTEEESMPVSEVNFLTNKASIDVEQSECGKVIRNNPIPLVLNGQPTMAGQYPWQVALYHNEHSNIKFICGGTLVSQKHVVTAAHCVTLQDSGHAIDQNTLSVYLGKHNLRTSTRGVQIRFVAEIIVHPQYSGSLFAKDLSILNLLESVQFTEFVRPACLWPEDQVDLTYVIGKIGHVVGWGINENALTLEELELVEMPVVRQETCVNSHVQFFGRFTSDTTYCAGSRDGTTVCKGDSGGGMVVNMEGTWYLRGLVSLGVPDAIYVCNPSHYVIFTDLAKFLPWIKEIIHFTN